jgi:hypothetical protein
MTRASAPCFAVLFSSVVPAGTNPTFLRLIPDSVVRGSDELRGENVPDRAWRAARSLRSLVHDTHRSLAGTA